MNRNHESPTTSTLISRLLRGGFALLVLLGWLTAPASSQTQAETSVSNSPVHAKHVLGFEDVRRNASGELSIQDDDLRFQKNGRGTAQVSITSIHSISLVGEDRQVGGLPMMLGKAAVPFGGGRVVSLFSHKKYDSLAIEYTDSNGGFHGAVFRLSKGQGRAVRSSLVASGVQLTPLNDPASIQTTPVESLKGPREWSVRVARIDPGDTTLDPSFSDAIYENMLRDLPKLKRFEHVFRSGDRNANGVSSMLVMKTVVEKYSPGSETRRAVTTIAGATKVKVRIQLLSPDGHVVLEHTVEGNVRFIGDNLRATNNVAHNATKFLQRAALPDLAAATAQQSDGKEPTPIQ